MTDDVSMQMKIAVILIATASLISTCVYIYIMMNTVLRDYTGKFDTVVSGSQSTGLVELAKYSSVDGAICYSNVMDAIGSIDSVTFYIKTDTHFDGVMKDIRTTKMVNAGYPHNKIVNESVNGVASDYRVFTLYSYLAEDENLNVLFSKYATDKFRITLENSSVKPLVNVKIQEVK